MIAAGDLQVVGSVQSIARFPVKSMRGEELDLADVLASGVRLDRVWAVRDGSTGELTSAKRLPALLRCAARFISTDSQHVEITLPDGARVLSTDPTASVRISAALKHDVTLEPLAPATDKKHYRLTRLRGPNEVRRLLGVRKDGPLPDMSQLPLALLLQLAIYATPPGTYFDAFPLHLITTNGLTSLSRAAGTPAHVDRFRANLVLHCRNDSSPFPELDWCGRRLLVGHAEIEISAATFRCGMPAHAQTAELRKSPEIVRTIYQRLDSKFGVYARVIRPGPVRAGDPVVLAPRSSSSLGTALSQLSNTIKRTLLDAYLSV